MVECQTENIYLPCVEPLLDTWAVTKLGGEWEISPSVNLSHTSVEQRNTWCAEATMSTIEAFSSLARVYSVYFDPLEKLDKLSEGKTAENVVDGMSIQWDFEEPYERFLQKVHDTIKSYSVDIYIIYVNIDLFVYVRTEESPDKPIRAWLRKCGDHFYGIADIQISLEHLMNYEPFLYFGMHHTLFYPDSWKGHDDNTELFELNRPLLEEALKNWEQKFNAEIEIEGLPQIYKYGFLPYES